MRYGAREPDLVVVLPDLQAIYEFQLGNERPPPQRLQPVQVGNVADNKVPAVDRDSIPLPDQPPQIVIMIDQLVKH